MDDLGKGLGKDIGGLGSCAVALSAVGIALLALLLLVIG